MSHVDDMTLEQRAEYRMGQVYDLVVRSVGDADGVYETVIAACVEARTEWLFAALGLIGDLLAERAAS